MYAAAERFLPAGTNVAIRGGKIRAVGRVAGLRFKRRIDASGLVVSPGFIDVHTHVERNFGSLPFVADSFAKQGVTTLITGNCGTSKLDLAALFRSLEKRTQVNVASLIGHNSIREEVMKDRARERATPSDIAAMQRFVEKAMRDGALGFSTGLAYSPGIHADEAEIVALAKTAAQFGGMYVTHLRDEGINGKEALQEAILISKASGAPLHVSHLKIAAHNQWKTATMRLEMLAELRRNSGVPVSYDVYAYDRSSTSPDILLPPEFRGNGVRQLFGGGGEAKRRAFEGMYGLLRRAGFENYEYAMVASFGKGNFNGLSVPEIAARMRPAEPPVREPAIPATRKGRKGKRETGPPPVRAIQVPPELRPQMEAVLYLAERGPAQMVYHDMAEEDMLVFLKDDHTVIGSDAGVRYEGQDTSHPRGAGNFVRILGHYVREEGRLTLEEALRKMTSLAADTFGLSDIGRIKEGYAADLVLFNPDTVRETNDYNRAVSPPEGIEAVLVRGTPIIDRGLSTRRRPGTPVRRKPALTAKR